MRFLGTPAVARLGFGVVLLLFLGSCTANPVTGRREFVLLSTEEEVELGEQAAQDVVESIGLVKNPALSAYVEELGQRLAAHSPRDDLSYTFNIVDMPESNAFALPGGYIYVSRGLLAISNSEDELANVLAHEIGHVAARHHAQQQTRATGVGILTLPSRLIGAIVGDVVGSVVEAPFQVAGMGFIAAYGRRQEREADRVALQISAAAGYDPSALARFLDTLERDTQLRGEEEDSVPSFFDTHPSTPNRVREAAEQARGMHWKRTPGLTQSRADYLSRLDGLLLGHNPSEGIFQDELFLHPDLDFALEFPKEWKTLNTHVAVTAWSPDEKAQINISLQAGGTSPDEAASVFIEKVAKEISIDVGHSESLEIGGLPAHRAVAVIGHSKDLRYLDLTWIAHRGRMIRIIGVASPRFFENHRRAFAATAGSFRPLVAAESETILDTRLRSESSRLGETLESFGARTQNTWNVEETAVANALERDEALPAGALVKIAIQEPHLTLDD